MAVFDNHPDDTPATGDSHLSGDGCADLRKENKILVLVSGQREIYIPLDRQTPSNPPA